MKQRIADLEGGGDDVLRQQLDIASERQRELQEELDEAYEGNSTVNTYFMSFDLVCRIFRVLAISIFTFQVLYSSLVLVQYKPDEDRWTRMPFSLFPNSTTLRSSGVKTPGHSQVPAHFEGENESTSNQYLCGHSGSWNGAQWLHNNCKQYPKLNTVKAIFLGDSTMLRLSRAFISATEQTLRVTCKIVRFAPVPRCGMMEYLGITRAKVWEKPNQSTNVGPLAFGLGHPFCNDCSGCDPYEAKCPRFGIEYLPVEFAKDMELQSNFSLFTQENIRLYLSRRPRNDVAFVNSGLHDQNITGLTSQQYVQNVQDYLSLLVDNVRVLIWLSTSAPRGDANQPQTLPLTLERNQMVHFMIKQKFPRVFIMDVYNMTIKPEHHADNVHMKHFVYQQVAALLFKWTQATLMQYKKPG